MILKMKLRKRSRRPKTNQTNELLDITMIESDYEDDDDEEFSIKVEEPKIAKRSPVKETTRYTCKACKHHFTRRLNYENHVEKKICLKKQLKPNSLGKPRVKRERRNKRAYLCKKCPLFFETILDLKMHRKEHKPKEFIENHTYTFDDAQELYICNTCSAEFKDEAEAEKHTKKHGEVFDCSVCGTKFQTLFQLGSHLKAVHTEDDQFTCPLCPDQKFPKASLFMKHIDTKHQKKYTYTCRECAKGFHSKTLCREHMNIHLGIKPFSCIVCGASFTYSKSVVTHQLKAHRVEILGKSHSTECEFCKNRFVSIASLERHIEQVHSTPKPPKEKIHLCDICGMGFAKKNKMVVHQRVHTGVKPYPCRYCDKHFSKSGERNCHERIHTGERPYSCEYCGKAFRQSAPFKVHIRTHTGERPYVCDLCTKGFTTNQGLKQHRKNCTSLDIKAF